MNNNAAEVGFFFDPTPNDDVEFSTLSSPFAASKTPASGELMDFYETILHEIGHAMGIALGILACKSAALLPWAHLTLFSQTTAYTRSLRAAPLPRLPTPAEATFTTASIQAT
jgi:hypothetical protein